MQRLTQSASSDDNSKTVIGYVFQSLQLSSVSDLRSLIKKLVSLNLGTIIEKNRMEIFVGDENKIADELLLSQDGRTYLRSEIQAESVESRKNVPVYFIKKEEKERFIMLGSADIQPDTKGLVGNQLLAKLLGRVDIKTGLLLSGFDFPEITPTFESMIAYINTAVEDLIWLTCQSTIRIYNDNHQTGTLYPTQYETSLNVYSQFFKNKQQQLSLLAEYLNKLVESSKMLADVKDKDLSPEELQKSAITEKKNEQTYQIMHDWQTMQSDKLYVDQGKLNLGYLGLVVLVCAGAVGPGTFYFGYFAYVGLSIYNTKKRYDFDKQRKEVPDRVTFLQSQMPAITYLNGAIKTDIEKVTLKIASIDNEMKFIQQEKPLKMRASETAHYLVDSVKGTVATGLSIFSRHKTTKEEPKTDVKPATNHNKTPTQQPIVEEPDDTVISTNPVTTEKKNESKSTVIIEDVSDQSTRPNKF